MDISRQSNFTYYLSYMFIGDTPQLSLLTEIKKKKNNIEVTITVKLNSKTGYGPGNQGNTKLTGAIIRFLDPEGIEIDSMDIEWFQNLEEGFAYQIEVYNEQGALVGFDFVDLLSEENADVIITITCIIDPSSIEGKDLIIRIEIYLTGVAGATDSDVLIVESDETLPEDISIC